MHLELTWKDESLPVDVVDGRFTAGGGEEDAIHLPGFDPGLLLLDVRGDRLMVTARKTLRIGEALFPAGIGRLVMAGEAAQLADGVVLRRALDEQRAAARQQVSTACLARQLLSEDVDPADTRAGTLTCLTGAHAGTCWALPADTVLVGRGDDTHVQLADRAVSRRHFELTRFGRDFRIVDLGGLNGVFVNGRRVATARVLASGDLIELGQTVLRYDAPLDAPEERTVIVTAAAPAKPGSGTAATAELRGTWQGTPAAETSTTSPAAAPSGQPAGDAPQQEAAEPVEPALAHEATLPLGACTSNQLAAILAGVGAFLALAGGAAVLFALR